VLAGKTRLIISDLGEGHLQLRRRGPPTERPDFVIGFLLHRIHPAVVEADVKLKAIGWCARFGMDDGYFVGPRDVAFIILSSFATRIREETGRKLVPRKCKWCCPDPSAAEKIVDRELIPDDLSGIEEGIYLATNGDLYMGIHVFNAPIGEPEFVAEALKEKAYDVRGLINDCFTDLQDGHHQEM